MSNQMNSSEENNHENPNSTVPSTAPDSCVLPYATFSPSVSPALSSIVPSMSGPPSPSPLSLTSSNSGFAASNLTSQSVSSPFPSYSCFTFSSGPTSTLRTSGTTTSPISSPAFSYSVEPVEDFLTNGQLRASDSSRTQDSFFRRPSTPNNTTMGPPTVVVSGDRVPSPSPHSSLSVRHASLLTQPDKNEVKDPARNSKTQVPPHSVSISLNSVTSFSAPSAIGNISEPCFRAFRSTSVSSKADRTYSAPAFSYGAFPSLSPSHHTLKDSCPLVQQTPIPNEVQVVANSRNFSPATPPRDAITPSKTPDSVTSNLLCKTSSGPIKEKNPESFHATSVPVVPPCLDQNRTHPPRSVSLPDSKVNRTPSVHSRLLLKSQEKLGKEDEDNSEASSYTLNSTSYASAVITDVPVLNIPRSSADVTAYPGICAADHVQQPLSPPLASEILPKTRSGDKDYGNPPSRYESMDSLVGVKPFTARRGYQTKVAKKESFHLSQINLEESGDSASYIQPTAQPKLEHQPKTVTNVRNVKSAPAGNFNVQKFNKSVLKNQMKTTVTSNTGSATPAVDNGTPAAAAAAHQPYASYAVQHFPARIQERSHKWKRRFFWLFFCIFAILAALYMIVYFFGSPT